VWSWIRRSVARLLEAQSMARSWADLVFFQDLTRVLAQFEFPAGMERTIRLELSGPLRWYSEYTGPGTTGRSTTSAAWRQFVSLWAFRATLASDLLRQSLINTRGKAHVVPSLRVEISPERILRPGLDWHTKSLAVGGQSHRRFRQATCAEEYRN